MMSAEDFHALAEAWRQLIVVIKADEAKALRLMGLDAHQIPKFVADIDQIAEAPDNVIVALMLPAWLDWQERGAPRIERGTYVSMGDTLCYLMQVAGQAAAKAKEAAGHA